MRGDYSVPRQVSGAIRILPDGYVVVLAAPVGQTTKAYPTIREAHQAAAALARKAGYTYL